LFRTATVVFSSNGKHRVNYLKIIRTTLFTWHDKYVEQSYFQLDINIWAHIVSTEQKMGSNKEEIS
jgi:hypothetical protein